MNTHHAWTSVNAAIVAVWTASVTSCTVRGPTRSASMPAGTETTSAAAPAIVSPRPTWRAGMPTISAKYRADTAMNIPVPSRFTKLEATRARCGPGSGLTRRHQAATRPRPAAPPDTMLRTLPLLR